MKKAEILKADEKTLQTRWNELINDKATYAPGLHDQRREYLMIGERLALMRKQMDEAIMYSIELYEQFGEALTEVEE